MVIDIKSMLPKYENKNTSNSLPKNFVVKNPTLQIDRIMGGQRKIKIKKGINRMEPFNNTAAARTVNSNIFSETLPNPVA